MILLIILDNDTSTFNNATVFIWNTSFNLVPQENGRFCSNDSTGLVCPNGNINYIL
jgi:hypothetical protein